MNVLYILDYGTVGGATKAFVSLMFQFRRYDMNPIVITGGYNELNECLETEGIRTIPAGHVTAIEPFEFKGIKWPLRLVKLIIRYYYKEFKAIWKVAKSIDLSEIDLIHTNSARNTLGCRLSRRYGIPHIVHIREFGDKDFDCVRLTPFYYSLLNRYTVTFLSVSKAVMDYWNSKGIEASKNNIVYDGVIYNDISVSSEADKNRLDLKMVINGGVFPTKGQHIAVEAIGLLPKKIRDNISLDIVGWFSERYVDIMKKYAKERNYENRIRFLGSRDDIHERMGQYQIGLMCSRSEGFGLVTVEYMHGQLGVIASNSGACPELVDDGCTGLLFQPGDANDLARCIEMLYNDRKLLIRLSCNAQKEALSRFTININADKIYTLYKEILHK